MKYIIYRISSKSYEKERVKNITKFHSLTNMFSVFHDWQKICIADNCSNDILSELNNYKFDEIINTSLGNPGSFWKAYEVAMSKNDDDIIYFLEDDYLHLNDANAALTEGLTYFDYITLYNHPDKYGEFKGHLNPYVHKYSELCEYISGKMFSWRLTNSTTMTFAAKVKTLKDDKNIWEATKYNKKHYDFENFCILTKQKILLKKIILKQIPRRIKFLSHKKRFLGLVLPGLAIHLEKNYILEYDKTRFKELLKLDITL